MSVLRGQNNTQQSDREIQFSVKEHIPEPRNLLPSQLLLSEPARHILPNSVTDFESEGRSNCILDLSPNNTNRDNRFAQEMFKNYGNNIGSVMRNHNKIVFMSNFASQKYQKIGSNRAHEQSDKCDFGAVDVPIDEAYIKRNQRTSLARGKDWEDFNKSQIQFNDSFESSNIYMALKQCDGTYLITARLDYNTFSYGQWFYFRMKNITKDDRHFRIVIINMTKTSSMFGNGLKVSVCRNGQWRKEGEDINYQPNYFKRRNCKREINLRSPMIFLEELYHSLSFTINMKAGEEIYVAYNQPYTYSKLGRKIDQILLKYYDNKDIIIRRSVVSRTVLDNRIDMLTVTLPWQNQKSDKKIIVITARTHPVETAGSFVMEGILEQLCRTPLRDSVRLLLENYIIKIIPMINPDGVIVGNSRCNIKGYDLNRMWNNPNSQRTPEVFNILKMILKLQGRIAMFIDLHGHSKKKNVFAYGCHDTTKPFASREFPYLLSKINQNDFLFKECRFTKPILKRKTGKEGTARLTLWRKLKIHNIFTIENSYCSAEGSKYHYDEESYRTIGQSILEGICLYFESEKKGQVKKVSSNFLEKSVIFQELRKDDANISIGLMSAEDSQSEMEERINQSDVDSEKSKGKDIQRSKKKQKALSIVGKSSKQSKSSTVIETRYHKNVESKWNIIPERKGEKPIRISSQTRRLQSMLELKKFPLETELDKVPKSDVRGQTFYKNLIPLKRTPYKLTKVGKLQQETTINFRKTSSGRTSKNINFRDNSALIRQMETVQAIGSRGAVLSIIEFGPKSLLPPDPLTKHYSLKNSVSAQKTLIFLKDKRSGDSIRLDSNRRADSIGVYQLKNVCVQQNQHKLHDLIAKINRNKNFTVKQKED